MARTATYEDLRADGDALRRRLSRRSRTTATIEALARDVRVWELRCAVAVAVRSPRLVAGFRSRAGALQELVGRGWTPSPDWEVTLDEQITAWQAALAWTGRSGDDLALT